MIDHFDRLGLPRRFVVDTAELERQYLARGRAVHPDYHQLASAAEKQASLELSAALNEAYATLRDPFRRAEHLLALHGGPSASEQKQLDPAFLMETLELREEIEEVKATGDAARRAEIEQRLTETSDGLFAEVARLFERLAAQPGDAALAGQVRQRLNALKYVRNLLRDLRSD